MNTSTLPSPLATLRPPSASRALAGSLLATLGLFTALPLLSRMPTIPAPSLQVHSLNPAPMPDPIQPTEPPPPPPPAKPLPPPPPQAPSLAPATPPPLAIPLPPLDLALPNPTSALALRVLDPIAPPSTADLGGNIFAPGEVDALPRPLRRTPPLYPARARLRRQEGHVTMEFVVTREGEVQDLRVVDADPPGLFDAAAEKAIRSWRFEPGKREGQAVPVRVRQVLDFQLEGAR